MDGIVCCCLPASKASSTDHIIPLLPECFSVVSLQVGNWKENVLHGNAVRGEVVFSTKNTNVKGGHFLFVCLQRAYLLVFNYQLKRNQARWVLFWPESNSSSTLIAGTSAFSSYLYRHWRLFFFLGVFTGVIIRHWDWQTTACRGRDLSPKEPPLPSMWPGEFLLSLKVMLYPWRKKDCVVPRCFLCVSLSTVIIKSCMLFLF